MRCLVCNSKLKDSTAVCVVCDFENPDSYFINQKEADAYLKDIVIPFRERWLSFDNATTKKLRSQVLLGDSSAMNNLGNLYYLGKDVTKNYAAAMYFYEEAIAAGCSTSAFNLARIYDVKTKDYPNDFVKALYYYELGEKMGCQEALLFYGIGSIYAEGRGVSQNLEIAIHYYKKAIDYGMADAAALIGEIYYDKYSDYIKAFHYYKKAEAMGCTIGAMYNCMGAMYATGKGAELNYQLAEEYYRKAISKGNKEAERNLLQLLKALENR